MCWLCSLPTSSCGCFLTFSVVSSCCKIWKMKLLILHLFFLFFFGFFLHFRHQGCAASNQLVCVLYLIPCESNMIHNFYAPQKKRNKKLWVSPATLLWLINVNLKAIKVNSYVTIWLKLLSLSLRRLSQLCQWSYSVREHGSVPVWNKWVFLHW